MAKAKNHTDNIDSVTLGNIETNSAFVKRFSTHYPISFNSTVIRETVLAITLLWNRARNSILNLSKSKRKIMKLLSVDDSIFIFFHMVHWLFIFGQGWLLCNNFCKACQNCLYPSFEFVQCSTQCSADAWIVALSWKLPQMPSCSANDANLDKNNFDMFYEIYCCACHPWPNMNEQCTKWKYRIMLSCSEISVVISVFDFEKFGVKPGFP